MAPGSCFWTSYGARLYNRLQELMRAEYRARGFDEVITPNITASELFKRSGHYQNYRFPAFIGAAAKLLVDACAANISCEVDAAGWLSWFYLHPDAVRRGDQFQLDDQLLRTGGSVAGSGGL
ncbi:Threonine--tRNA ligase, cytoplasmic [Symbiodinium microadriaticum]|uniref:Threonine--tRNA ligase, cytoplasmic n=1 Tax=Symbiodinium microadriaticum TaxID=2951 RepID=A0A1Q9D2I2_SYMMI|nr:Threonine--tRNA ligase, cytoplasmic [Symbiodinium microadriaticum]